MPLRTGIYVRDLEDAAEALIGHLRGTTLPEAASRALAHLNAVLVDKPADMTDPPLEHAHALALHVLEDETNEHARMCAELVVGLLQSIYFVRKNRDPKHDYLAASPKNLRLYSWIGEDERLPNARGTWGIKRGMSDEGVVLLVSLNKGRMETLTPHMQAMADHYRQPYFLMEFGNGEIVGTISPSKADA